MCVCAKTVRLECVPRWRARGACPECLPRLLNVGCECMPFVAPISRSTFPNLGGTHPWRHNDARESARRACDAREEPRAARHLAEEEVRARQEERGAELLRHLERRRG